MFSPKLIPETTRFGLSDDAVVVDGPDDRCRRDSHDCFGRIPARRGRIGHRECSCRHLGTGPTLIGKRCHDGDLGVGEGGQRLHGRIDPRRPNAVIVGDQDAQRFWLLRRSFHGVPEMTLHTMNPAVAAQTPVVMDRRQIAKCNSRPLDRQHFGSRIEWRNVARPNLRKSTGSADQLMRGRRRSGQATAARMASTTSRSSRASSEFLRRAIPRAWPSPTVRTA